MKLTSTTVHLRNSQGKLIKGTSHVKGWGFNIEGIGLVVHKDCIAPGLWVVTEVTTGGIFTRGDTRKTAIAEAQSRFDKYGIDRIRLIIANQMIRVNAQQHN